MESLEKKHPCASNLCTIIFSDPLGMRDKMKFTVNVHFEEGIWHGDS